MGQNLSLIHISPGKPQKEGRTLPPIRVLQIMPAMDAGGMETFVMNVYRAVDRSQVPVSYTHLDVYKRQAPW